MAGTNVGGDANLVAMINLIQADLAALRTAYNAHKHTGVTVGGGTSGVTDTADAALTSDQIVIVCPGF